MAVEDNPQEQGSSLSGINALKALRPIRTCDNCREQLGTKMRKDAKYCSDKCRYLHWHKKKNDTAS